MNAVQTPVKRALLGTNPLTRLAFSNQGYPMTFREVLEELRDSQEGRLRFVEALKRLKSSAYFFELPALSQATVDLPFEAMVVDGPPLQKRVQNPAPFAEHFKTKDWAVAFRNLSGDAELIAPTPRVDLPVYAHLAAFVLGAPEEQVIGFWRLAAEKALDKLSDKSFFLSTAGLGVPWLHLRLDNRPKYYRYEPYT